MAPPVSFLAIIYFEISLKVSSAPTDELSMTMNTTPQSSPSDRGIDGDALYRTTKLNRRIGDHIDAMTDADYGDALRIALGTES